MQRDERLLLILYLINVLQPVDASSLATEYRGSVKSASTDTTRSAGELSAAVKRLVKNRLVFESKGRYAVTAKGLHRITTVGLNRSRDKNRLFNLKKML